MKRAYFASVAMIALTACSATPSSGRSTPATFTEVYAQIFPVKTKSQCTFCHGLPPNQKSNGNLSVGADKASAYAALVGKPSSNSKCQGQTLVVPKDANGSLFFEKLSGSPPCGDHMPLGGESLSADEVDMVRSWIEAGAKDD